MAHSCIVIIGMHIKYMVHCNLFTNENFQTIKAASQWSLQIILRSTSSRIAFQAVLVAAKKSTSARNRGLLTHTSGYVLPDIHCEGTSTYKHAVHSVFKPGQNKWWLTIHFFQATRGMCVTCTALYVSHVDTWLVKSAFGQSCDFFSVLHYVVPLHFPWFIANGVLFIGLSLAYIPLINDPVFMEWVKKSQCIKKKRSLYTHLRLCISQHSLRGNLDI